MLPGGGDRGGDRRVRRPGHRRRRVRAGARRGAGASGGARPAGHRAAGRAAWIAAVVVNSSAALAPPADRSMAGAPAGRPGPGGRRSSPRPDRRRHRPAGPPARRVVDRAASPAAAAVAALAAVVADLTLLGIITGHVLTSPGSSMWALVIVAASASLTRVTLAGRAARRCLTTRHPHVTPATGTRSTSWSSAPDRPASP